MSQHQKEDSASTVIEIDSVSKAFAAKRVLSSVSLTLPAAQSLCLCGINGAGKTTLLRIISGLLHPDHGSVHLCGCNVSKEPEKTKPRMGVISHKSMVYPDLTVRENLNFFATLYGVKKRKNRIDQLTENIGLFPYRYEKAAVLSRGLLQRLAIARALVHQPALLLADEPFTGLDAEACKYLVSVLNAFTQQGGTIIMTTHDTNIGLRCCNRVVVLDGSRLIFDADTTDIDIDDFAQDYLSYARGAN